VFRGVGEAFIFDVCSKMKFSIRLLVLDNIDVCCYDECASDGTRSISQLTQTSSLRSLIDKVLTEYPRCFILCTSNNHGIPHNSTRFIDRTFAGLDSSFLQPYRIGATFHIQPLNFNDRISAIKMLFRKLNITAVLDGSTEVDIGEHLAHHVSTLMQVRSS
jgi:hypothetical protein